MNKENNINEHGAVGIKEYEQTIRTYLIFIKTHKYLWELSVDDIMNIIFLFDFQCYDFRLMIDDHSEKALIVGIKLMITIYSKVLELSNYFSSFKNT